MASFIRRRLSGEPLLLAVALALLVVFLWPTLAMPYLGDDTFNAYLDGWIGYEHQSLGAALWNYFAFYSIDFGRFYPVFPLIVFFDFHVVHSDAPAPVTASSLAH